MSTSPYDPTPLAPAKNGLSLMFWNLVAGSVLIFVCGFAIAYFYTHSPRIAQIQRAFAGGAGSETQETPDVAFLRKSEEVFFEMADQSNRMSGVEKNMYVYRTATEWIQNDFRPWFESLREDAMIRALLFTLNLVLYGLFICGILHLLSLTLCACTPSNLVKNAPGLVVTALLTGLAGQIIVLIPWGLVWAGILQILGFYCWFLYLRRIAEVLNNERLTKSARRLWRYFAYSILCFVPFAFPKFFAMCLLWNYAVALAVFGVILLMLFCFSLYVSVAGITINYSLSREIRNEILRFRASSLSETLYTKPQGGRHETT